MKSRALTVIAAMTFLAALAIPFSLAAQHNQDPKHKHHHYKLIVLGTLGGPQSFGDAGHSAGNLDSRGTAAGVADTAVADPYYPNFNPLGFFPDPFVHHAFLTQTGALEDLGALSGPNSSSVTWITDNGLASGQSLNGNIDPLTGWPEENAVFWKDGQIKNLGTLGGYESQSTGGGNTRGQVVGFSGNGVPDSFSMFGLGTETRAFLWEEGTGMQDLGTLGGSDAFAVKVNENGQVVGVSYINSAPGSCFPLVTDSFLWERGKGMVDLGSLGGTCTFANALNNRGQVVGLSNLAGDTESHAFFWEGGMLNDIGSLGGTYASPNTLNEAGDAAGQATTADGEFHAFFWQGGPLIDLGPLPGFGDTTCIGAFGINAQDQVTGQAVQNYCAGPGAHAFLWESGQMIDLNVFVPPGSGFTLVEVEQLNDRGEMFGIGTLDNGNDRAFLLIPCDENHPGVEGCDYSMVDVSALPSSPPAVREASGHMPPAALLRHNNRFHFPGRAISPRD